MDLEQNRTAGYELTIIVPIYNEEDNMRRLSARLAAYLPAASRKACVLFVNDGSTDGSGALIRSACAENSDFMYLEFAANRGLSAALKAGIDHVRSPLTAYIDADMQTAPEELELLLPHAGEHALVTGVRAKRRDTPFKKIQSRIANSIRRSLIHDGARDTGCPLKVLQTECAQRLPFFNGMHRFFAALVQMEGGTVMQIDVSHFPRTAGVSKFSLKNRFLGPLLDCLAVRWMQKRHISYDIADSSIGKKN